jgi:hypothetical protein
MQKQLRCLICLCALFIFWASPLLAQFPHLIYHATLSGGQSVPAVTTEGRGLLTFLFNADRSKVTVSGLLTRLEGPATGVALHLGKPGETGAVLLDLTPITIGRRVQGELAATPDLFRHLFNSRVYASARTAAHPTGEVRGQVMAETDLEFRGVLTGAEAVPPTNSPGVVFGGLHFPTGADDVYVAFAATGLSGPITGASICEAAPGANGPTVIDVPTQVPGTLITIFETDEVPADFFQKCAAGKYYVVAKTDAFPDGEVRGQLSFLGNFCAFSAVNRLQQVPPPPSSTGFGMSHTAPNATLDSLTTTVGIDGIAPTSATVRVGAPGTNGTVLVDLESTPLKGVYTKTYPISPAGLTDFAQGRLYIQFGTAAYPNGEIRGQIKTNLRKGYAFDLCGDQMAPWNNSAALGMGMFSMDQADCYINYLVMTDGLGGQPTEGHIWQGATGQNGSQLYPMDAQVPLISGIGAIKSGEGALIESGGAYMTVHTPLFPDGEIRGQIRRGTACPLTSSVPELGGAVSAVRVSPVPFADVLQVRLESVASAEARLTLRDVLGGAVFSQNVRIAEGENSVSLLTGHLPTGAYLLCLEAEAKPPVALKRVVKVAD